MTDYKPKLIEVALPLAAINKEAAREKSIRHGHPSTLHLWWARRPLAAARAVIWASLVDDPSADDTLSTAEQEAERQRLFEILKRLVKWENSNDPDVLAEARAEIDRCFPEGPPPILDPFAGGGAIPLEAQRLGLKALSGDLNPVAVLIQKAMLEIPPRFVGRRPVHPDIDKDLNTWSGAQGLAADVEAYGKWMRDEAERRIGHLYPDVIGPDDEKLTPIAWIWARTVQSPDPAWRGLVPLVSSWVLRNKTGKPRVWIEPIIDRDTQTISYCIREGGTPSYDPTIRRGKGVCIATGVGISSDYIKEQGRAGRLGSQLVAVVVEGRRKRVYCDPTSMCLPDIVMPEPNKCLRERIPHYSQYSNLPDYGFDEWWKLFLPRQIVALNTLSDLLAVIRDQVISEAKVSGFYDDEAPLFEGGHGAQAYADAVVTYLAFVVDRCVARWNHLSVWNTVGEKLEHVFRLNAFQMTWRYSEGNPFCSSSGNWQGQIKWIVKVLKHLPDSRINLIISQQDARIMVRESPEVIVSTDPPYYDNVPFADLSDFFYVWLRHNIADVWPNEFATLLTPKEDELTANRYRAGSKQAANEYFETGMAGFMKEVYKSHSTVAPATIYYAYKATETKDGEVRSTGWATFLQAVVDAGLQVTATWPMRTEMSGGTRMVGRSALSSSVVLTCRPRPASAPLASRSEFLAALRSELPSAVSVLQSGNIAPVDLAQSTIGPGIKVFSRYAKVVEADGSAMSVSDALALINDELGEILDGAEAELDADTRFAVTWYTQHGYESGPAGDADNLARAKNTSLAGIESSGIGRARAGSFRIHRRGELASDWSPVDDDRLTVWEATQYLVAALNQSEAEAAELLHQLGGYGERARQLAYVLFKKASEASWADEAAAYNELISAWPILQSTTFEDDPQQQLL